MLGSRSSNAPANNAAAPAPGTAPTPTEKAAAGPVPAPAKAAAKAAVPDVPAAELPETKPKAVARPVIRRRPRTRPSRANTKARPNRDRRVDGVTVAGESDDEPAVRRTRERRTDSPSRAGKTPIAERFDDWASITCCSARWSLASLAHTSDSSFRSRRVPRRQKRWRRPCLSQHPRQSLRRRHPRPRPRPRLSPTRLRAPLRFRNQTAPSPRPSL